LFDGHIRDLRFLSVFRRPNRAGPRARSVPSNMADRVRIVDGRFNLGDTRG
jgi:hypothetical protein